MFRKKNTELLDMMRVLHYFKNKKYEYVLNPLPKHKGDKLVGCINGKYKLAVRDDMIIKGRRISNLFRRLAYSDTIVVDKTEMEFCRFKRIMSFLGDCEYKTGIPVIKKNLALNMQNSIVFLRLAHQKQAKICQRPFCRFS